MYVRALKMLLPMIILHVIAACGGGSGLVINTDGEVETGVLSLDSLPQGQEQEDYRIGFGDVLSIQVLYHSEYTRQSIRVLPDGKISYPYVGIMHVVGMTVPELELYLAERFGEIIREPRVTVILTEYEIQRVYVIGEVKAAGGYPVERDMTLLKALAQAQGVTKEGKRNGVLVIRRLSPFRVAGIQIDLTQLLDEHHFELDIPLRPYDIVYVPRNRIARASDFLESFYNILDRPMSLYLKGWQIWNVETTYEFYRAAVRTF